MCRRTNGTDECSITLALCCIDSDALKIQYIFPAHDDGIIARNERSRGKNTIDRRQISETRLATQSSSPLDSMLFTVHLHKRRRSFRSVSRRRLSHNISLHNEQSPCTELYVTNATDKHSPLKAVTKQEAQPLQGDRATRYISTVTVAVSCNWGTCIPPL